MIYDRVQESWTKIVMTLLEGDSEYSNQSAQREIIWESEHNLSQKPLERKVLLQEIECNWPVKVWSLEIGCICRRFTLKWKEFLNLEDEIL
jgi:hypothetical protein